MADKARVAVVISGEGSNMGALLYASRLPSSPYEVVLVASNNPDAPGLALAEAEGVATWARSHKGLAREAFDDALHEALAAARPDVVALAGYMRVLTPGFVRAWEGRLLNIHPSLLPAYPGLDTHARALEAGDTQGGCTVHLVTEKIDSGEILGQLPVAIRPGDTADTLAQRVRLAEHQLYPATLSAYLSRHQDAGWIEAQVDALAAALPEVLRKTNHGAPGWAVGSEKNARHFAILADRHHGEEAIGLLVKASGADEMNGLIEADPDLYYWPKYYGASGWLGLRLNRPDTDWSQVSAWLERSWAAVAPSRLTKLMRVADDF
jgi:phosphoribosylglycinamide formyltransferase-1